MKIIEAFEIKNQIEELSKTLEDLEKSLDVDRKRQDIKKLEEKTLDPNFWDDSDKATALVLDLNGQKDIVELYDRLKKGLDSISEMVEILSDEEFSDYKEDLEGDLIKSKKEIEKLKIQTLLSGEYDKNNAIISFNAGSGGLEATDWAEMLMRMYQRWFDSKKFKYILTDINKEDAGGIKSATLMVKGRNAYGLLKGEKGVHRLVRISPFDSNKRRHTSFASVDIYPELDDDTHVDIDEKDLRIDTFRASGAGGQHVNTTDSAVRITHIPTGVTVSSQSERSQIKNRATAMKMLMAKLIQIKEEEHKEKIEDIQGKYSQITWGSQIRSYVFQPYTLVKDHRSNFEVGNIDKVMDGDLDDFINAYLNMKGKE